MNTAAREGTEQEAEVCAELLWVGPITGRDVLVEALGRRVAHVSNIREASVHLERRDCALLVIDVDVVDVDDPETVGCVRTIASTTQVIVLTGDWRTCAKTKVLLHSGAADVLTKPLDHALLRTKVRTFTLLHRQKRDLARIRTLYDADRRLTRQHLRTLTSTSSKLASCMTTDDVVQAFISDAHTAVGAVQSCVHLCTADDDRGWELVASRGHAGQALLHSSEHSAVPIVALSATPEAVWVSDGIELEQRFPRLRGSGVQALVALPILMHGSARGVVTFSFRESRVWDIDRREFFLTLVAAFGAALERARLLNDERRVHDELERQSNALRLLADVGTLLSSSLDYTSVLAQLTQTLVPALADWCTVDVRDADGRIRRLAAYHADPIGSSLLAAIERDYPKELNQPHGVPHVLRTGKLEWLPDVTDALLVARAKDVRHVELLRELGPCSSVIVPLLVRGRILGALTVVSAASRRRYTDDDVRYLEELARRAALSLDNANLYQQQVDAREALERQVRHGRLVEEVATALTRSQRLHDALKRCADAIVRHVAVAVARIWTLDTRGEALELQASAGTHDDHEGISRVALARSTLGTIARGAKPYLTNNLALEPWVNDPEWKDVQSMAVFAGYPLVVDGRMAGVLAVFSEREVPTDTLAALASIADAVAIGLDRTRAEERARLERDTLEIVNEVGRALAAELDHERLVQLVIDYATRLAGAEFGAFLYDVVSADGECGPLYAVSGVERDVFSRLPMPCDTQVFAPTVAGERVLRSDDVRTDPLFCRNPPTHAIFEGQVPVVSYLVVPVVSRTGRVIGRLSFGHPEPRMFTFRHEVLVVGVAAQAAIALDNARLFKEAQRLIAELDKSNKELDQFAYVASHDLKAPLRGISNLAQWLEEDLGQVITPAAQEHLGLLRNRVRRLDGLIDGILNYSRAGRVRTKVEHVATGKLLAEVIDMMAVPTSARIQVDDDMPELYTERVPLQLVFMNLVSNAVKHAARLDPHVEVVAHERSDFFEFAVSDNGPGIAPEFHERIWGIFQTLSPRDVVEGAGIGLSVVKKIVESKGGRVNVVSSEGAGSTFSFTWPKFEDPTSG